MTKQIVVISGKGGTGKTSIVCSLATLINSKIIVDCDVDASDLHLILKPNIISKENFYSGLKAKINSEKCIKCGKCEKICKFNAIKNFKVNEIKCEGCGACYYQCKSNAIELNETKTGEWYISKTRLGKLIHAKLEIAQENSGKLVSKIKSVAALEASKDNIDYLLIDGSPGTGCPVIASISGANIVLIVIEPTMSGLHDAKRVVELTKHFNIKPVLCINKFDINEKISKEIEKYCQKEKIRVIAKIPYNEIFTKAMIKEKSIIEYDDNNVVAKKINLMWNEIKGMLDGK